MASPCNNSPDEVIEKIVLAKANADKFDRFVNGTATQTVQLGSGSPTPTIRNVVRQIKADGEWIKRFIADAPEGDVSLNNATALGSITSRTLTERFSDVINVKDFGAAGNGATNDTDAFSAFESIVSGRMINLCGLKYVVDEIPCGNYYYNGSFIKDEDEYPAYLENVLSYWSPRGLGVDDMNFFVSNGVTTPEEIEAQRVGEVKRMRGVVSIGAQSLAEPISNGTYLNDVIAIGNDVLNNGSMTSAAEHNIGLGAAALHNITSGDRNVAIGSLALFGATTLRETVSIGRDTGQCVVSGQNNVFLGYQALGGHAVDTLVGDIVPAYDASLLETIAIGRKAGQFLASGQGFIGIGSYAGQNLKNTNGMTVIGYVAGMYLDSDISENGKKIVAVSDSGTYSSLGDTITCTVTDHHAETGNYVVIKFTSGDLYEITPYDQYLYVTSVNGNSFTLSSPISKTAQGNCIISSYETSDTVISSASSVAVGYGCLSEAATIRYSECIGVEAAKKSGAYISTSQVIGYRALPVIEEIERCTFIGQGNASNVKIAQNTVNIGSLSMLGSVETTGDTVVGAGAFQCMDANSQSMACTAIGHNSLDVAVDGTKFSELKFSTGIGYQARVSGDNQLQLGRSATTVYAYGAVQNRSDARDKTDVRDTVLGLDFLMALRPVDFRWDYREDYIETVERDVEFTDANGQMQTKTVFETVRHKKDGSRKRVRFHHGLIAQEVKSVMDDQGIDFGGYQDHSINGGRDILSIGYGELICPIIRAIQQINMRLTALEG